MLCIPSRYSKQGLHPVTSENVSRSRCTIYIYDDALPQFAVTNCAFSVCTAVITTVVKTQLHLLIHLFMHACNLMHCIEQKISAICYWIPKTSCCDAFNFSNAMAFCCFLLRYGACIGRHFVFLRLLSCGTALCAKIVKEQHGSFTYTQMVA